MKHAAANGSLDLIKALLDAGADPYQADTKGHRAIDYLLGYGPTPPNSRLSERQRQRAAQWLF
ncbi:ankyrin repeat domain-containing protein [Rhodanobacter sp. 7MK24]|nr:ankyrin repeat domain-containing protein [Rhodanobacter sp. 7MK24]